MSTIEKMKADGWELGAGGWTKRRGRLLLSVWERRPGRWTWRADVHGNNSLMPKTVASAGILPFLSTAEDAMRDATDWSLSDVAKLFMTGG